MSRTTIGEVVSRIRGRLKSVRQDAFLTDRFIYSIVSKHMKWLIKREDGSNKLMRFSSVFQTIDHLELIETDLIEAGCSGLKSCRIIKRSKEKVPVFMQGYFGPLIRDITSIDGSQKVYLTTPADYRNVSNSTAFKYNKTHYFWYLNDYLYFPELDWDAVRVEAIFEEDISSFGCDQCHKCIPRQLQSFNIPDYLQGELEAQVLKDFGKVLQTPSDPVHDNLSPLK